MSETKAHNGTQPNRQNKVHLKIKKNTNKSLLSCFSYCFQAKASQSQKHTIAIPKGTSTKQRQALVRWWGAGFSNDTPRCVIMGVCVLYEITHLFSNTSPNFPNHSLLSSNICNKSLAFHSLCVFIYYQ